MPQFIYPTSSAGNTSGKTKSSAVSSNADAFMSSPSGGSFSNFQMGFKVGYTAVDSVGGTWLAYRSAKQEKKLLRMQAELLNLQSQSYHTAADDAMASGERQAAQIGYEAGQAKSSARAAMAASGVRVGASGSSAEVLASIDIAKEMQVNQTMANAVATAWGYRRSAVDYSNQALAYESAASSISPWAAAVTTFAGKAMDVMGTGDKSSSGKDADGKSKYHGASSQDFSSFFNSFSSFFGKSGSSASGLGGK